MSGLWSPVVLLGSRESPSSQYLSCLVPECINILTSPSQTGWSPNEDVLANQLSNFHFTFSFRFRHLDKFHTYTYFPIPHTDKLTQGCGVGLADVKLSPFIDITLFDTQMLTHTQNVKQEGFFYLPLYKVCPFISVQHRTLL